MTKLILVRHGETEWNSNKTLQGQADIELSERGRDQGRAIAGLVRSLSPDVAIASDLRRTREMATLLGFPDANPTSAWREADLGQWTGMTVSEITCRWPSAYQDWRDGRLDPPGAEGWQRFRSRIGAAIDALPRDANRILVSTHGGVIRAALSILIGLEPNRIVPVANGSVTVLELGPPARLRAYNLGAEGRSETSD